MFFALLMRFNREIFIVYYTISEQNSLNKNW